MITSTLIETAQALVADGKGLLAMDESVTTCDKRFAKLGIPQTEEARRAYRELLVTTPGLGESISGAILFDATIRERTGDGTPFLAILDKAGIIPGIKVDIGAKELAGHPGEKITEGLDGLRERLAEYFRMGARFAKCERSSPWERASPAEVASRPTRRPWPDTRRSARKPGSSPSSSLRCS